MDKIVFKTVSELKPGDLFKIIYKTYQPLLNSSDKLWKGEVIKWQEFDSNAFNNYEIGKCIIVSYLNKTLIGLASYDPRQWPQVGIIGQNCILPKYQGRGYGKT